MFRRTIVNAWKTPSVRRNICLGVFGSVGAGLLSYKMYRYYLSNKSTRSDTPYDINRKLYDIYLKTKMQNAAYFFEEREDDWELIGEVEGCRLYSLKVPYSDFYVVKGETVVKTRKSVKVASVDYDTYKKVSPNNVYMNLLCAKKHRVMAHARWTTEHSWIVKDRDFVLINEVLWKGDKVGYIFGGSIDKFEKKEEVDTQGDEKETDYPSDPDCVRGNWITGLWRVKRVDKNHLLCQFVCHIEPMGYIPRFVYNRSAIRQGISVLSMAQVVVGKDSIVTKNKSETEEDDDM